MVVFNHCSRTMSNFHPHLILSRPSISALPHTTVSFAGVMGSSVACLSWHPEVLFSCFRGPLLSCPLPCLSGCFLPIHPWLCLHRCTVLPSFIFFLFYSHHTQGFLHFLDVNGSWSLCSTQPPSELPGKGWLIGVFHLDVLHMSQCLCVKAHAAIFLYIPTPSEFWEKHPQAQSCQGQKPQIGSRILLPLIFRASESLRLITKIFQIFHL